VRGWYEEMPKAMRADQPDPILLSPRKDSSNVNRFKIDEHFNSLLCINCGTLAFDSKPFSRLVLSFCDDKFPLLGICEDCRMRTQATITDLMRRRRRLEKRLIGAHRVCSSCTASAPCEPIECESLDCPWLYERKKAEFKVESVSTLEECILDITSTPESPSESVFD
jgi:DNA polymerase zeta